LTGHRYRLSLQEGLEAFRSELEFACSFLDRSHFVERGNSSDRILHYGANPPPGAIQVPAVLFPGAVRLDSEGIHLSPEGLATAERGNPGLVPPDREPGDPSPQRDLSLGYDALGLIFLLLSRLEERGFKDGDRYGRFPFSASFVVRHARLDMPICDWAVADIAAALTGDPSSPSRTAYRVWMTHDWDRLRSYHRPQEPIRNAVGDILRRHQPLVAARRISDAYFSGEPWLSLRKILTMSEAAGHRGHFFFMGRSDDPMDSPYMIRYPELARKIGDEITQRGHKVGFHPGFRTSSDSAEWRRQKADVEDILYQEIEIGRQHMLMFDCESTLDIWDEGGMKLDMTLAYPERPGFRTGTCRSHGAYSLRKRRTLRLLVYPTALMDFGFFGGRYRDISPEQAVDECSPVIETCKRLGGDLVVLYHPGQWSRKPTRTWYSEVLAHV
jgi:peptidoglycan/xylan/chitin deacetylase (PgdA/CDA1 family)